MYGGSDAEGTWRLLGDISRWMIISKYQDSALSRRVNMAFDPGSSTSAGRTLSSFSLEALHDIPSNSNLGMQEEEMGGKRQGVNSFPARII